MNSHIQPASAVHARRQLMRVRHRFDEYSAVFRETSRQLKERLELLAVEPERVLDLGCRSGYQLHEWQQQYPEADVIGCDLATSFKAPLPSSWSSWLRKSPKRISRLDCDPHHLPFDDEVFDLVVSNLLLPWCHSPHQVFEEVARVLKPGGAFMFTTAGPDTLHEYRAAWAKIDVYSHEFGLIDMHDIGDSMIAAGFAAPVLDRDMFNVDYPSIGALQNELRQLGAGNIAYGRRRGLMAPDVKGLLDRYSEAPQRFLVSVELVHGHGWKGELGPSVQNSGSEYKISVDSLRGSRGGKIRKWGG